MFWNDANKARGIIEQTNALKAFLTPHDALTREVGDMKALIELAEMEGDSADGKALLKEGGEKLVQLEKDYRKFETQALLSGKFDANNAYLTLNAGAGGTESCDWASILYRMFTRYAEDHGFKISVLDEQKGEEAGIKSISFMVSGPYAYGYFKGERGVHRLVRISPFDSNKRRHTSFAALDVVAEVDDTIEIEIRDEDLRVDTFRSSGAGGQHVNKTDSAIRIVHNPTGIVVSCQAERSQHSNRDKAMKMLKAKLYELEMDNKRKEMEKFYGDKGEIAWGRQIRSYVLQPYQMVKDHRTGAETSQAMSVLDGDLDLFIEANLRNKDKMNAPVTAPDVD
jgi:peptide chain release factor 2